MPAIAGGVALDFSDDTWANAPRVDIVCRAYAGGMEVFWKVFMPTYLIFWPISAWKSSGVVVILDSDSPLDHQAGAMLQNLGMYPGIEVKYEAPPPDGTTCSKWRREGYSRQQWSGFYADLYSDADYVAIIDTDSAFIAPVLPEDLFENEKPIVRGLNTPTHWESSVTEQAIGGYPSIGRFMSIIVFPVVIKSSHLVDMRRDITANLGASTFEEAFHKICSYGEEREYSQFEIMMNYLWYHKREEYSWHIADPKSANFAGISPFPYRATNDSAVLAANIPTMIVMEHWGKVKTTSLIAETYKNLCIGTGFTAGDCGSNADISPGVDDGAAQTLKWSVGKTTWQDTHKKHVRKVLRAKTAFGWLREGPADFIDIGG